MTETRVKLDCLGRRWTTADNGKTWTHEEFTIVTRTGETR